jgi:signal peptidase I
MIQEIIAWFHKKNKSPLEDLLESAIKILPLAFLIRTFFFGLYIVPTGSMEPRMLVGERFFSDKLTVWFTPVERGEIIALNSPTYPYSDNPFMNWYQRYVWGPDNWTKRVIGIPGDHVKGVIEDGKPVVYLNGKKLDEPYINPYPLVYVWRHGAPSQQDLALGHGDLVPRTIDPSKPLDQQPFYNINPADIYKKNDIRLGDLIYDPQVDCCLLQPGTPVPGGYDVFDIVLGENEYWVMGDNREGSCDSRHWGKLDGKLIHGRIRYRFFSIQFMTPWSWWIFDESWLPVDLIIHPISFWQRVRWARCFGVVQ